jgi:outer membrane protein assembly factor BamB
VDGDGRLEILHGEFGGSVLCLNAETGSAAWEISVDPRAAIQTAPTLLDADGDGQLDFVVATWNRTSGDTNRVSLYRGRDQKLLWSFPLANVVYHGSAVTDLDHDGRLELLLGDYSGTIYALNAEDGSVLWTHRHPGGYYIGGPVSLGDLNGDGTCEAVAVDWYNVLALNADGSVLWEYDIDHYASCFRGAALADIDGDARPDVLFGTSRGQLVALRGTTGTALWTLDLAAQYGDSAFALDHAPVVADLDGDGTRDVFIVGGHGEYPAFSNDFGRAYAVSAGQGTGPEWRMFQLNAHRDASLCAGTTDDVSAPPPPHENTVALSPLPARDLLYVEARALRAVVVYDALGRAVAMVSSQQDRCTVDVRHLSAGLYLAVVASADGTRARAFLKE